MSELQNYSTYVTLIIPSFPVSWQELDVRLSQTGHSRSVCLIRLWDVDTVCRVPVKFAHGTSPHAVSSGELFIRTLISVCPLFVSSILVYGRAVPRDPCPKIIVLPFDTLSRHHCTQASRHVLLGPLHCLQQRSDSVGDSQLASL